MLDINKIRAEMATYLAENASHRHSLDAAVMHVVQIAYQQGMRDAAVKSAQPVEKTAPAAQEIEMIRACNACSWTGNESDCVYCGAVGPLCPECHETTDAVLPPERNCQGHQNEPTEPRTA